MFLKRPATLIYLDPPYFTDRTRGYAIDAYDEEFHINLLNTASKAKCMVFISGYDNDLYNSILTKGKGWGKRTIDTITKDIKGNDHQREEVVWANQYFQQASKLKKLLLRLTKTELNANKINPERK
jgi:DNA adenine methylase